jgi:DNA-directed RNA polymerase subunit alpha
LIEIEKPKIECVEMNQNNTYGKFVIEPLERGYGITLGNSLRRILLSSLPGSAATSIKIDGVLHEFSTIPGVVEDVTEIILNIKSLAFKMYTDEPKTVYIQAEGAKVITGADIKTDADIEVLNPDAYIATLNENGKLYMEITVEKSRGYVPAERNKVPGQPIGVIPIDSIFTPVKHVNYRVENTRVGKVTDYDRLILEITTNGNIKPDEAMSLGAKILSEHLKLFIDLSDHAKNTEIMVEKEDDNKEKVLEMGPPCLDSAINILLVVFGATSPIMVCGNAIMDMAKIMGITPDIFTLIGRCVLCPPYIFLPTTLLAYWIGILRSASWI